MKLDNFSKIQIAVFGIQYMANSMASLSRQIEGIERPDPFKQYLEKLHKQLSDIYEEAADLINDHDTARTIDVNLLTVPSDILLFGMDDTEKDYYIKPL